MPPAARVTDMHTCPMVTVLVPHVGGPILPPGQPTCLINFLPAATVTNMLTCVGPPDTIVKGSAGVFIGFLPAARMGDLTAHGGVIVLGSPNVIIGEIGSPSPGAGGVGGIAAGLALAGMDSPSANPSKYGHGTKKHSSSPCSGKGLNAPANEKEFAKDMKQLQKDWKSKTPDEREAAMKAMVNKQLAKSGVPTVNVKSDPSIDASRNGQMDPGAWQLQMNPNLMSSSELTDKQTQDLGNTLYHESRHAQQWYIAGQLEAAQGKKASEIQKDLFMGEGPSKAAAAHPMPKNDPMAGCAQSMVNSFSLSGKGAQHRSKVLTALGPNRKALNDAVAARDKVYADPKSTDMQKKAAQAAVMSAYHTDKANYDQYTALPEEADAWHTGNSAEQLLKH